MVERSFSQDLLLLRMSTAKTAAAAPSCWQTRILAGSRLYLWCVEIFKFCPQLLGVSYSTSLLIIIELDVLFCHKQQPSLVIYTRPQNSVFSPPPKKFKLYHFQVSKACACLDLSPQPCFLVLACKTHLAHVSTASQVHNTRAQLRQSLILALLAKGSGSTDKVTRVVASELARFIAESISTWHKVMMQ